MPSSGRAGGGEPVMAETTSYDTHQRQAVLLTCAVCRRSYFVTQPVGWTRCAVCR